jgi:hypothetical protein
LPTVGSSLTGKPALIGAFNNASDNFDNTSTSAASYCDAIYRVGSHVDRQIEYEHFLLTDVEHAVIRQHERII